MYPAAAGVATVQDCCNLRFAAAAPHPVAVEAPGVVWLACHLFA
jgi:hypothetical protein